MVLLATLYQNVTLPKDQIDPFIRRSPVSTRHAPPIYAQPGSEGPVFDELKTFLQDLLEPDPAWKLAINGLSGGMHDILLEDALGFFQGKFGLEADKACGPRTRQKLATLGFNFDERAAKHHDAVHKFIQNDGKVLFWTSGIEAQNSEPVLASMIWKRNHGN